MINFDQLDGPDGPAGQTLWTDQFSILEALASSHIQRLTIPFVHCRSFRVRRRPCLIMTPPLRIVFENEDFWLKENKVRGLKGIEYYSIDNKSTGVP